MTTQSPPEQIDSAPPRETLLAGIIRVLGLLVFLTVTFVVGVLITSPEKQFSLASWFYCRWPLIVFVLGFIAQICGWLKWRHLFFATILLTIIHQTALSQALQGKDNPPRTQRSEATAVDAEGVREMTTAYGEDLKDLNPVILALLVLVPGSLGIALAAGTQRSADKKTGASYSVLNLIIGSLMTTIVLGGSCYAGLLLFAQILQSSNFGAWFHFGWPVFFFAFTFFAAINRLLRWPHVVLATLLLAIAATLVSPEIPAFIMSAGKAPSFDPSGRPPMLKLCAFLLKTALLPGLAGIAFASWANRRDQTPGHHQKFALVAMLLIAASPAIRWIGHKAYAQYSSTRAWDLGASSNQANGNELKSTDIVPTLDSKIIKGRNLVWCATMQLAWEELRTLAGGDVHMDPEDPSVAALNKGTINKGQLHGTTYTTVVTFDTAEISKHLKEFTGKSATPKHPPGGLMIYSNLIANLPFQWAFERHPFAFTFNGTPVESFGIIQYDENDSDERLAAGQVNYFYVEGRTGQVIELKSRVRNHHIYLAAIPPRATLGETVNDALDLVKNAERKPFPEKANLIVPVIDFDFSRDYPELTGRPLKTPNLSGTAIDYAAQNIRFKLDERGAAIESTALMGFIGEPATFEFSKPFLVILQYGDISYFAAWVDNAELLIKK